jgi:hypothetical protein
MRRLLLLLCALALSAACSEPPQKEIDRAQGALDAARAAGAELYASSEYSAATTSLQQAHDAVTQGDYRLALSRALDASERAQQAARQAADGKARARSEAEVIVATTATAAQQLRSAIKAIEPSKPPAAVLTAARRTASSAESALQEARALLKEERYLEVGGALNGVQERISAQMHALNEAAKPRAGKRRT